MINSELRSGSESFKNDFKLKTSSDSELLINFMSDGFKCNAMSFCAQDDTSISDYLYFKYFFEGGFGGDDFLAGCFAVDFIAVLAQ